MAAKKKTNTSSLDKNLLATVAYIPGLNILLVIVNKDSFVRFHAMQSTLIIGLMIVLTMLLVLFTPLVTLTAFVLSLYGAYQANQGVKWEAPIIGQYASQLLKKIL